MSILIKGMEMPNHCAMCKFHGRMDDPMISQHWCEITGTAILNPYKERCSDCPLVEVPPHGRLIDADELIRFEYGGICFVPVEFIDNAPTVIEAEGEENGL